MNCEEFEFGVDIWNNLSNFQSLYNTKLKYMKNYTDILLIRQFFISYEL